MSSILTSPEIDEEIDTSSLLDDVYHVVVLNDPVNLMSYVVMVFRKVFGFDKTRAEKHMMEVHQQGRSVVWTGDREKAENYVHVLQTWQLTTILEKNDYARFRGGPTSSGDGLETCEGGNRRT